MCFLQVMSSPCKAMKQRQVSHLPYSMLGTRKGSACAAHYEIDFPVPAQCQWAGTPSSCIAAGFIYSMERASMSQLSDGSNLDEIGRGGPGSDLRAVRRRSLHRLGLRLCVAFFQI